MLELEVLEYEPIKFWCENLNNIKITQNPMFHARTKHIKAQHHFIREKIQLKHIDLAHIPSKD
jgi:histone deacetylase 1/2